MLGASEGMHCLRSKIIQMGGERNKYLGGRESISERVMLPMNRKRQAPGELIKRARRGWYVACEC